MNEPILPNPEPAPEDLAEYAAVKFDAIGAALERGDSAGAERHLRELGAEGSTTLARGFTDGLMQAGMAAIATRTPLEDPADEQARARFLAAAEARPRTLPDPGWSAGQERRYLLRCAVLFQAYAAAKTGPDEQTRDMVRVGAQLAASGLILFDARHDTHLGQDPATHERSRLDPAGYVAQEREAAETY